RRMIEKGVPYVRLQNEVDIWPRIKRAKAAIPNEEFARYDELKQSLDAQLDAIEKEYESE
ncbi:MAG: hypothetical protein H5T69_12385, partial [Chloroflexi bacterium]|nr:hypothetical protein [Chloroflexota bacterium]